MTTEEAKADLNAQIEVARKKFAEKAKQCHTGVYKAVVSSCALVERTAKEKMRDTITNPDIAYGKRMHHPSMPGEAPAPDNGTMLKSVTHVIEEDEDGSTITGYVGSTIKNPPYPAYLENGTSRMEPHPWLEPSIKENKEAIKKLLSDGAQGREVEINGTD